MWIVAIAWMYVAVLMAVAEATNANGTVLGAIFTFFLYGLGPMALVMYLLGAPARRKARKRQEQEELQALQAAAPAPIEPSSGSDPDGSTHASGDTPITPERKES